MGMGRLPPPLPATTPLQGSRSWTPDLPGSEGPMGYMHHAGGSAVPGGAVRGSGFDPEQEQFYRYLESRNPTDDGSTLGEDAHAFRAPDYGGGPADGSSRPGTSSSTFLTAGPGAPNTLGSSSEPRAPGLQQLQQTARPAAAGRGGVGDAGGPQLSLAGTGECLLDASEPPGM